MPSLRYEIGPIRPPSEAYSLLLRLTRGCPWNKCEFCSLYKSRKFERRTVSDIKRDIDTVARIRDELVALSWRRGEGGAITDRLVEGLFADNSWNDCARSVVVWLYFGGKHVFLQDANSLVMPVDEVVEVLEHLTSTFPSIDRITSYARSQTIAKRLEVAGLSRLRNAGLTRLHIGLESGSDQLLRFMRKGVTREEHVEAGLRVKESGIELSEYVILGLGGREWWQDHTLRTAEALNRINPDFIRFRTLKVLKEMPLFEKLEAGTFLVPTDEEILREQRLMLENLEGITSWVKSDHILNLLEEIEGRLPDDKGKMIAAVDRYFDLGHEQRLVYRMGRRSGIYRGLDDLADEVTYARLSKTVAEMEAREAGSVEKALSLLLERYI